MRIQCPECDSELALGDPKPGSYRPTCKHCGNPFRLKIGDGDSPSVVVTKDSKDVSTRPIENRAASAGAGKSPSKTSIPDTTMEATIDGVVDQSAVQATLETTPGQANRTAGKLEATMDATVQDDSSSAPNPGSVSVRSGSDSAGFSVQDEKNPGRSDTASPKSDSGEEMPSRLGGYRILRLIGRGAMGAVYEAKQVSLDRLVALKTIRSRLADNASSLARFTREAYAAAQLTHHNVVQIYDFGEDEGKHFFSMEWVKGGPLSDLVAEKGAIEARLAAGYILQAARGLQFAHRNGMVHRDVKPANLLLSDEGVVKVADLGLVKIPDQIDPESDVGVYSMSGMESGTQVTIQGTAVGTPAYMAPEQGLDAAGVDHRADIYSLGCTMFFLLTGKPPFDGTVVSEVMDQHARQPLPEMTELNDRIPPQLQTVVERAMAKRPSERYESLAEMIRDLESYLGLESDGKFSPTISQADQWEAIASRYEAATATAALMRPAFAGLVCLSALLTLLMPLAGLSWILLGPAVLFAAIASAALLGAGNGRSASVHAVRNWIGSLSWLDLLAGTAGAIVFLIVTVLTGLMTGCLVGLVVGVFLGAAFHFGLVMPVRQKKQDSVEDAERFIRNLRIEGADEEGVRLFAARYGGRRWFGLVEDLFGYESARQLRDRLKSEPSYSESSGRDSIRDRFCEAMAKKTAANRQRRDHQRLAKIEQRGLQSEGLSEEEAKERGWQMAAAIMDGASDSSHLPGESARSQAADSQAADSQAAESQAAESQAAEAKRQRMKAMLADARSGKYAKKRVPLSIAKFALGGQTRLLAGCLLLFIFAIWAHQTGLLTEVRSIAESAATEGSVDASSLTESATSIDSSSGRKWSIGIAGLLLAMSSFVSGWRMSLFAVPATILILFGPSLGVPGISIPGISIPGTSIPGMNGEADSGGGIEPWIVSAFLGVLVYVPGVIVGESKP